MPCPDRVFVLDEEPVACWVWGNLLLNVDHARVLEVDDVLVEKGLSQIGLAGDRELRIAMHASHNAWRDGDALAHWLATKYGDGLEIWRMQVPDEHARSGIEAVAAWIAVLFGGRWVHWTSLRDVRFLCDNIKEAKDGSDEDRWGSRVPC